METNNKQRILMILGAGAATAFGGKITKDLTKLCIEQSVFETENGKFLKFLQSHYFRRFHKDKNVDEVVNFEVLVEILQSFYEYYTGISFDKNYNAGPAWPNYFNIEESIITEINLIIQKYFIVQASKKVIQLNPKYQDELAQYGNIQRPIEEKELVVIEIILESLFNSIIKHVFDYSNSEVGEKARTQYSNFIGDMQNSHNVLRVYNTNYDDLLMSKAYKKRFINGFNTLEQGSPQSDLNINSILNDFESDCFYNLHGSVNFITTHINSEFQSGSNIAYFNRLTSWFRNNQIIPTIQENKTILNPTIITGNQKILHTSLEPYHSFFNTFQRDCRNANKIVIIGFSMSDDHIKKQITGAIYQTFDNSSKKLKIYLINYFENNESLILNCINYISKLLLGYKDKIIHTERPRVNTSNPAWLIAVAYTSKAGNKINLEFNIYTSKFECFLNDSSNWKIILE